MGPCRRKTRKRESRCKIPRRKSKKNLGAASRNGHVTYGVNEFDCLFLILAPNDIKKRDTKYWNYCCIPVKDLIDKDNPDYLVTRISSEILKKNSNWKAKLIAIDGG